MTKSDGKPSVPAANASSDQGKPASPDNPSPSETSSVPGPKPAFAHVGDDPIPSTFSDLDASQLAPNRAEARKLGKRGRGVGRGDPLSGSVVGKISPSKCLQNPRFEIFAQEVVKGTKPPEAYRLAGYKNSSEKFSSMEAAKMLRMPKIAGRIGYLQQKAADATIITRAWLLHECQSTYLAARANDQYTPALKALEMLGREFGTFIPKEEHGKPGDFSQLSDAELNEQIARRTGELSLAVGREAATSRSAIPRGQLN